MSCPTSRHRSWLPVALVLVLLALLPAAPARALLSGWIGHWYWPEPGCQVRQIEIYVTNTDVVPSHHVEVELNARTLLACESATGGASTQRWDYRGYPELRLIAPGETVTLHMLDRMLEGPVQATIRACGEPSVVVDGIITQAMDCAADDRSTLRVTDLDGGELLPGDRVRLDVRMSQPCPFATGVLARSLRVPTPDLTNVVSDGVGAVGAGDVTWTGTFPDDVWLLGDLRASFPAGSDFCALGEVTRSWTPPEFLCLDGTYLTEDPARDPSSCDSLGLFQGPTCTRVGAPAPPPLVLEDWSIFGVADPFDTDVKLADVELDGDLDAITFGRSGFPSTGPPMQLRVHRNDGTAVFAAAETLDFIDPEVTGVVFDVAIDPSDGLPDLGVSDAGPFPRTLFGFTNNGNGTFQPSPLGTGAGSVRAGFTEASFHFARVDGDATEDAILVAWLGFPGPPAPGIHVALASGEVDTPIDADAAPGGSAVADFDGDLSPDVALSRTGGELLVQHGSPSGSFARASRTALPEEALDLAAGDFAGSPSPDLALITSTSLYLLEGRGDGTFTTLLRIPLDVVPTGVAVGNLAPDPTPEIVVGTRSGLVVYDASGVRMASVLEGSYLASRPVLGDLDGNGTLDIVVPENECGGPTEYRVLRNDQDRFTGLLTRSVADRTGLASVLPLRDPQDLTHPQLSSGELVDTPLEPLTFYGITRSGSVLWITRASSRVRPRY